MTALHLRSKFSNRKCLSENAVTKFKANILSSFATNSIENLSHAQVDDLLISTMASLCSNLDTVVLLKKRVIKQRRLALWYNSQICTLKQTPQKFERKWHSSNLDFHLAWTGRLKMYIKKKALRNARSLYCSAIK